MTAPAPPLPRYARTRARAVPVTSGSLAYSAPAPARPRTPVAPPTPLVLVPTRVRTRSRTPFVVLLLVLMISGLVGLLVLNTVLAQGSFRLQDLQTTASHLNDSEQTLSRQADALSDPTALAARAAKMGMVPGGVPQFVLPGAALPKGAVVVPGGDGSSTIIVVPARPGPAR